MSRENLLGRRHAGGPVRHRSATAAASAAAVLVVMLASGCGSEQGVDSEGTQSPPASRTGVIGEIDHHRVPGPGDERTPSPDAETRDDAEPPAGTASRAAEEAPAGGSDRADRALAELVAELSPRLRQRLSDALYHYERASAVELDQPRPIYGPADAPVRITVLTDVACLRCATLHGALDHIRSIAPPDTFCIELRHYPLDGHCNPHIEKRGDQTVRCTAAKVLVCAERHPRAFELAGVLYNGGLGLARERALEVGAAFIGWDGLTACLHGHDLEERLHADADLGHRLQPESLPVVLVNGRRSTDFAPFLYTMVLTAASVSHPALDGLPPPDPDSELP